MTKIADNNAAVGKPSERFRRLASELYYTSNNQHLADANYSKYEIHAIDSIRYAEYNCMKTVRPAELVKCATSTGGTHE